MLKIIPKSAKKIITKTNSKNLIAICLAFFLTIGLTSKPVYSKKFGDSPENNVLFFDSVDDASEIDQDFIERRGEMIGKKVDDKMLYLPYPDKNKAFKNLDEILLKYGESAVRAMFLPGTFEFLDDHQKFSLADILEYRPDVTYYVKSLDPANGIGSVYHIDRTLFTFIRTMPRVSEDWRGLTFLGSYPYGSVRALNQFQIPGDASNMLLDTTSSLRTGTLYPTGNGALSIHLGHTAAMYGFPPTLHASPHDDFGRWIFISALDLKSDYQQRFLTASVAQPVLGQEQSGKIIQRLFDDRHPKYLSTPAQVTAMQKQIYTENKAKTLDFLNNRNRYAWKQEYRILANFLKLAKCR